MWSPLRLPPSPVVTGMLRDQRACTMGKVLALVENIGKSWDQGPPKILVFGPCCRSLRTLSGHTHLSLVPPPVSLRTRLTDLLAPLECCPHTTPTARTRSPSPFRQDVPQHLASCTTRQLHEPRRQRRRRGRLHRAAPRARRRELGRCAATGGGEMECAVYAEAITRRRD